MKSLKCHNYLHDQGKSPSPLCRGPRDHPQSQCSPEGLTELRNAIIVTRGLRQRRRLAERRQMETCAGRSREKPGTPFPLPSPDTVTWAAPRSPSNGAWQNTRRAASPGNSAKPRCPETDLGIGHVGRDAFMATRSRSNHSLTGDHINTK